MRAETCQMGFSLRTLLVELEATDSTAPLDALDPLSFPTAFTFAACRWEIPPREALLAYLWSWLDAQVLAYLKTGAAGQVAGQRMLARLAQRLPAIVERSEAMGDDDISSCAPGVALMSYAHELQDGRLFRS